VSAWSKARKTSKEKQPRPSSPDLDVVDGFDVLMALVLQLKRIHKLTQRVADLRSSRERISTNVEDTKEGEREREKKRDRGRRKRAREDTKEGEREREKNQGKENESERGHSTRTHLAKVGIGIFLQERVALHAEHNLVQVLVALDALRLRRCRGLAAR
jgi:Flp pilus assembly protein TadB